MKIGLGTVQFGLDYGISNRSGKTTPDEVIRILETAKQNGIRVIDTAALYGESERVLGHALPEKHSFEVIT
jgi:aryl-alcohol dehydrogenase-like predicted oxidoreductase